MSASVVPNSSTPRLAARHGSPRVTDIERVMLDVPFRPAVADWNMLLVRQYRVVEIVILRTEDPDVTGFGETLPHYTWGRVTDEGIGRARGRPVLELLGDDAWGAGLQMAAYDAAGKALNVPAWRLFNLPPQRDHAPIAWWNTKMPPAVLAEEARTALASGYRAHKIKLRPWFDMHAQIEAISAVTPDDYAIEPDFNDMLLDAKRAAPILRELDRYARVRWVEGPIPQRDVAGYVALRGATDRPIALHFGLPDFATAVRARMCDGFVLNQGVVATLAQAQQCAAFGLPCFLQFTGLGLTTSLMCHLAAVVPGALWPAVTNRHSFADDLTSGALPVVAGHIAVPDAPGLGVALDESALTRYRMSPPYSIAAPRHLLTVAWPDGRRVSYPYMARPKPEDRPAFSHLQFADATAAQGDAPGLWEDALQGRMPFFERGVDMTVWNDDGTPEWTDLYAHALVAPVHSRRQ